MILSTAKYQSIKFSQEEGKRGNEFVSHYICAHRGHGTRKKKKLRRLYMLARLREVIVPPAPEYLKSSSLIRASSSNENTNTNIELSVVVSPDVENEQVRVPKLTNDYVSVALGMACEKRALKEDDDDECERVSDSYLTTRGGSSFLSALKRRFVWTMAKIDVKTAQLRPMVLSNGKRILSSIGRELARQFPPIETYVMENVLMRRAMEEEEMAILNPDARRAFEESLMLQSGKSGKSDAYREEEGEEERMKVMEEGVEESILEAPMVVVTSRKKLRNKRSWLRGSAMEEEEASSSSASLLAGDADIEPPATPPQKEEELSIQLPPQKELAAITKAKQRLREEEEKAKRNAVLNSQSSNSTPLNFAPGWKKDVDFGDGTNAAVILASKSDVKSRKIRQPMKQQSNRKMTDMFGGSMMKGTPSPPGKLKKNNNRNASGNNSGGKNNNKKFSPPKSAKKRRQFEERRLVKLFEEEKENKSRLEYSYYCSAGDTDIYVEAVVKPIKGKAL